MKDTTITIKGKKYHLRSPGAKDLRAIDKYVLENRRKPMDVVKEHLDGLNDGQQMKLLMHALELEAATPENTVSPLEYHAVMDSREGFAFVFWLLAKDDHKNLTRDDVMQLIIDASTEDFERLKQEREGMLEDDDEVDDDDGSIVKSVGVADAMRSRRDEIAVNVQRKQRRKRNKRKRRR